MVKRLSAESIVHQMGERGDADLLDGMHVVCITKEGPHQQGEEPKAQASLVGKGSWVSNVTGDLIGGGGEGAADQVTHKEVRVSGRVGSAMAKQRHNGVQTTLVANKAQRCSVERLTWP